jgi:HSP20 family protein
MYMLHYDPFRDLRGFQGRWGRGRRGFPHLTATSEAGQWLLPLDVTESDGGIVVTASVPGFKPEDIEVSIKDNILTINAKSESAEETSIPNGPDEERFLIRERRAGAFQRSIRLPQFVDSDGAVTRYEHGVLSITMPKAEARKARRLTINASDN